MDWTTENDGDWEDPDAWRGGEPMQQGDDWKLGEISYPDYRLWNGLKADDDGCC